ncbi:unnamed protein product, partial [Closterium sp. Yama58-4]
MCRKSLPTTESANARILEGLKRKRANDLNRLLRARVAPRGAAGPSLTPSGAPPAQTGVNSPPLEFPASDDSDGDDDSLEFSTIGATAEPPPQKLPFDTDLALAKAIRSFNGGMGMSATDINTLLSVLHEVGYLKPSYKNSAGLAKYEKSLLSEASGTVEWRAVEVVLSNGMKVTVHVTSMAEALKAMYSDSANRDGFVVKPAEVYTSDKQQRIYMGPETGDGWIKMQEECPRGGVIAACILYSDGTNLSNDGRVTGHPVYFTLGNITLKNRWQPHGHRMVAMLPPLPNVDSRTDEGKALHREVFQLALDVVLEELKKASYAGIVTEDPFGKVQVVFPAVYAYVADHPEACKLAGTFASHKANFPCHRCLVKREDISNMEAVAAYRTEVDQKKKVVELLALPSGPERTKASKAISTHPIKVALWGFRNGHTLVGNPYRALLVEVMHALDLGVFLHIVSCIRVYYARDREFLHSLDVELQRIATDTRISGFRIPSSEKGGYFAGAARFQAFEHRTVMQVITIVLANCGVPNSIVGAVAAFVDCYMLASRRWYHTTKTLQELDEAIKRLIPLLKDVFVDLQKSEFDITKVHSLAHVVEDIIRSGVPMHYSANVYEYLHQPLVKRAYRASNKRDPIPQIVKHDVRMHMLRVLQASEAPSEDGPKRMVALQEAMESGCNTLAATSFSVSWKQSLADGCDKWKAHALAAPGDMTKLKGLLEGKAEEGEVLNSTIRVKNGMAIPGDEDFTKYSSQTHYVRACASFGDKPWFSDVAVLGEEEVAAAGGEITKRKVIWYAKLLLLFTIDVYTPETQAFTKRAYAFVRYFRATGAVHASKCPLYGWETGENEYQLLELDSILRVAHMVKINRDVHHPEANSYNHIDAAIRGEMKELKTLMQRMETRLRVSDEIQQTLATTVKNLLKIVHQPSWCNERTMEDACKKACDDLLKRLDVSARVIYLDEEQFKAAVVVHLALELEDFGKFNDFWKKGEWAKKCTDVCNGRRGKLVNKSRKASFKLLKYPDGKEVKDSRDDCRDYARFCVSEEYGLPWHAEDEKPFCSEAFIAAASKWQKKEGGVFSLSIDQLCYTMVAVEFEMLSRDRSSMISDSENNTREMNKRKAQVESWIRRASIPDPPLEQPPLVQPPLAPATPPLQQPPLEPPTTTAAAAPGAARHCSSRPWSRPPQQQPPLEPPATAAAAPGAARHCSSRPWSRPPLQQPPLESPASAAAASGAAATGAAAPGAAAPVPATPPLVQPPLDLRRRPWSNRTSSSRPCSCPRRRSWTLCSRAQSHSRPRAPYPTCSALLLCTRGCPRPRAPYPTCSALLLCTRGCPRPRAPYPTCSALLLCTRGCPRPRALYPTCSALLLCTRGCPRPRALYPTCSALLLCTRGCPRPRALYPTCSALLLCTRAGAEPCVGVLMDLGRIRSRLLATFSATDAATDVLAVTAPLVSPSALLSPAAAAWSCCFRCSSCWAAYRRVVSFAALLVLVARQVENDCVASMLVQVLGVKESADLQEGFGFFLQHVLTGGLEKAHAEGAGRGRAKGEGDTAWKVRKEVEVAMDMVRNSRGVRSGGTLREMVGAGEGGVGEGGVTRRLEGMLMGNGMRFEACGEAGERVDGVDGDDKDEEVANVLSKPECCTAGGIFYLDTTNPSEARVEAAAIEEARKRARRVELTGGPSEEAGGLGGAGGTGAGVEAAASATAATELSPAASLAASSKACGGSLGSIEASDRSAWPSGDASTSSGLVPVNTHPGVAVFTYRAARILQWVRIYGSDFISAKRYFKDSPQGKVMPMRHPLRDLPSLLLTFGNIPEPMEGRSFPMEWEEWPQGDEAAVKFPDDRSVSFFGQGIVEEGGTAEGGNGRPSGPSSKAGASAFRLELGKTRSAQLEALGWMRQLAEREPFSLLLVIAVKWAEPMMVPLGVDKDGRWRPIESGAGSNGMGGGGRLGSRGVGGDGEGREEALWDDPDVWDEVWLWCNMA